MNRKTISLMILAAVAALLVAQFAIATFVTAHAAKEVTPASELTVGVGLPDKFGCSSTGLRSQGCEFQWDPVTVDAGTTAVVWTAPVAISSGMQVQATVITNDHANSGCDAGFGRCDGFTKKQLVCTYNSGTGQCYWDGTPATPTDLGTVEPVALSDAGGTLVVDGGALSFVWTCPSGPNCSVGGTANVNPIRAASSSGGSSSSSGGSSSSGSSSGGSSSGGSSSGGSSSGGSPPTLTAVAPNVGSSVGGWPLTLTGTGFTGFTSVTVGGVGVTGCTSSSSTSITCTGVPSFGTSNGSTSAQTVTVHTPAGTASSSSIYTDYFYLPSNNTFLFASESTYGVTTSGSNVTAWADFSGSGNNWVGTSGQEPTLGPSDFGTTLFPVLEFNGTNQHLESTFTVTGGGVSEYALVQLTGTGNSFPFAIDAVTYGRDFRIYSAQYGVTDISSSTIFISSAGTADTNPHVFGFRVDGSGNAVGYVDSFSASGTLTVDNSTGASLGVGQGIEYSPANIFLAVAYRGQVSSGDDATIRGIEKALGGTP